MKWFLSICLLSIFSFYKVDEKATLFLVADSTVSDKPFDKGGNPEKGWGQVFPLYVNDQLAIDNHAINGRSTKSFIDQGRWDAVLELIKQGDYVLIEFGHNDQKKEDTSRYTQADGKYKTNLLKFIHDTRAKKATPILATPIVRRRFDENGQFYDTHGAYPEVVRKVAKEQEVPLLDLHKKSMELVKAYGKERSKQLFLHIAPGEYSSLPEGREDDTHLSPLGAFRICDLVVEEIEDHIPTLEKYIKP